MSSAATGFDAARLRRVFELELERGASNSAVVGGLDRMLIQMAEDGLIAIGSQFAGLVTQLARASLKQLERSPALAPHRLVQAALIETRERLRIKPGTTIGLCQRDVQLAGASAKELRPVEVCADCLLCQLRWFLLDEIEQPAG